MQDHVAKAQAILENEVPIERYIPQETHVSRNVVKCAKGEYQALFRLVGVAFDTLSRDRIDSYRNLLVTWLNSTLKGGEYGVLFYRVRRKMDAHLKGKYNNDFSERLANDYYDSFGTRMLQTELYLCISFKPALDPVTKLILKGGKKEKIKRLQDEYIDKIEEAAKHTRRVLKDFDLEPMGIYQKDREGHVLPEYQKHGDDDGYVYSAFKDFLGYLVNGVWLEMPLTDKPINRQVQFARNSFKDEYRAIKTPLGMRFASYYDMTDYAEEYETGVLDRLLYSDFEYVECMGFRPSTLLDGKTRLDRMEGYIISAGDVTARELDDFEKAKEAQKLGELVFGDFHYCLCVMGAEGLSKEEAWEDMKRNTSEMVGMLSNAQGFIAAPIEMISAAAFFASIPGNWDKAPRLAYISDEAFFNLACMHNFPHGKRSGNPWGEAVTILKTPSLQPYYYNHHVTPEETDNTDDKAPGNTLIVGQTGSGKTVVEAFLCSHLTKVPNIRMVFFDKDRGLEPFVRRIGGLYQTLEVGKPTGWAPFQAFEESPRYLAHLNELFLEVISEYGPVDINEKKQLEQGIKAVFKLPRHLRSVTTLLQNIPEAGSQLAQKLRPWAHGDDGRASGQYAWVFDNSRDELDFSVNVTFGFDYTEILEYPKLSTPMLMHLLFRNEILLDGRPYVYVMAEFWKPLENPIFTTFAKNKQKTIRKQNGFGIFDTQEPADMIKSSIGGTMVQQSVTKIFLPNPEAVWEDYEAMGCTRREYEIIKDEMHPTSRQFLIKQGHSSVRAMLDLAGMTEYLDILSGSTDNVELLESIIAEVGDDPKNWAGPYLTALAQRRGQFIQDKFVFVEQDEPLFTVE
jgi:type IV secretion system protein VirB4